MITLYTDLDIHMGHDVQITNKYDVVTVRNRKGLMCGK